MPNADPQPLIVPSATPATFRLGASEPRAYKRYFVAMLLPFIVEFLWSKVLWFVVDPWPPMSLPASGSGSSR